MKESSVLSYAVIGLLLIISHFSGRREGYEAGLAAGKADGLSRTSAQAAIIHARHRERLQRLKKYVDQDRIPDSLADELTLEGW